MNARDVRTGVIREVKKDGASEKGCEPILNKKMKSTKVQTLGTVMRHAFRYANGSHGSVNRLCMASLKKIVTANRRQRIRNIEVQNSWWIHAFLMTNSYRNYAHANNMETIYSMRVIL